MQTVMTFDDKGFGRFLTPIFPFFVVFTLSTFFFNPLACIPGVPYESIVRAVAETIAQETELHLPSQQLFFAEVMKLYTALGRAPVMNEVLAGLKGLRFIALDRRRRSVESLIVRIENIIQTFPCICNSISIPVNVLVNTDCSIEMRGVPLEAKRFLYGVVLRLVYLYQEAITIAGQQAGTLIIVIDEGSSIFPWSANAIHSAFDAMLTYAREYGMRLIIATQYSGERMIAGSVTQNTPHKIVLPISDGAGYPHVARMLNASLEEQEYMAKHRTVGKGFVYNPQVNARYEFAFNDASVLKNKVVPDEYVNRRALEYLSSIGITPSVVNIASTHCSSETTSITEKASERQQATSTISDEAHVLLSQCAQREITALHPQGNVHDLVAGMGELYADMQITAGQKKRALAKELEEAGFIVQHPVRVGRSTLSAVEIMTKGWTFLGLKPPSLSGKAGWFSRILTHCVMHTMKTKLYDCQIEGRLQYAPGEFKAADLLCRRDGECIAIEIVVTDPEYSAENARKDLIAGCDKVVFTAPTGKILTLVKNNVSSAADLDHSHIEFRAFGEFVS